MRLVLGSSSEKQSGDIKVIKTLGDKIKKEIIQTVAIN